MIYSRFRETIHTPAITLLGICMSAVVTQAGAQAPSWSQGNMPTQDTVALFKFDEGSSESLPATVRTGVLENTLVTYLHNHPALDTGQRMEHFNFNSPDVGTHRLATDTASAAMGNTSLGLTGNVRFRAVQIFDDANLNHLTVEAWLKWNDSVTSSDLRIGTGDRALRIIRDAGNPASDAIGFQGSHGVWRPSPAFTGFGNLPAPVADGEWFHVAMVVFNSEMHDHAGHWHYEDGSFTMIFVNGRLLGEGTAAARIDMADEELVFHGSDRIALWQTAGTSEVLVDEFTVWQADPTEGGTLTTGIFDNGRGGSASAENWMLFE